MIGQIIDARYKILRPLGSGGMGAVFEGEHVGTGRRFAIKVILPDKAARSDSLTRFLREARTMGRIESEHVVQVADTGQDGATGVAFMAMELLVGEDLSQLLERRGPLDRDLVLRIAAQALEGLGAAHEAGVVHRDLKPANLFLARGKGGKRIVKLLDFGIAKTLSGGDAAVPEPSLTKTGGILGSPSYMSPEQAGGLKSIDHRTDIWSFGAVLYHLLSGLPPYSDAETLKEVIVRICKGPPPPLREVAPSVVPDVSELVERAMAHDPAERFQSARAMLEEVERLLAGPATLTDAMVGEAVAVEPTPVAASEPEELRDAGTKAATHAGLVHTIDGRRSRRVVALAGVAAISVAVVVIAAVVLPSRFGKPSGAQPSAAVSATERAAEGATSAPADHAAEHVVLVRVDPASASVEIDGAPAHVEAGAVELRGAVGAVRRVRVLSGSRQTEVEVTLTERGSSPDVVRLDASPAVSSEPAASVAATAPSTSAATATATSASAVTATATSASAATATSTAPRDKGAPHPAKPPKGDAADPFGGVAQ